MVGIAAPLFFACLAPTLVLGGCGYTAGPKNERFTMTRREVSEDLARMRAEPVALERPVVILNGYRGPGFALQPFLRRMAFLTSGNRRDWHAVNYSEVNSISRAAEIAVNAVEARWPSDDPHETIEIDVIGISMGGLVAREAAISPEERGRSGKRLHIVRLYTIGTPHRGAAIARRVGWSTSAWQMQPGSSFLAELDAALASADYELIAYAQLNDTWVGDGNTSPPGQDPIWAPGTHVLSHFRMTGNRLITGDIARRLRGEEPIAEPGPIPPKRSELRRAERERARGESERTSRKRRRSRHKNTGRRHRGRPERRTIARGF